MNEENQGDVLATASYLTTKEDFADLKTAVSRLALNPNEVTFLRVVGFLLVLSGLVLRVFFGSDFYCNLVYTSMVLLGVVIGFYHDTLEPYLVRRRAGLYFDAHRERMVAQTIAFYEEKIHIVTDRYEADVPYGMLFSAYEDSRVFLIYIGLDEVRAIPKRAVSQDDCRKIREILSRRMDGKFKQEGVR